MFHPLVRVARCTWLQLRILDQTDVCSNSCHIFLPIHWSVWYRSEILTWQLRNSETPKAGRSANFGWQPSQVQQGSAPTKIWHQTWSQITKSSFLFGNLQAFSHLLPSSFGGFDAKVLPKPDIITAMQCVLVAWRPENLRDLRAEARARSPYHGIHGFWHVFLAYEWWWFPGFVWVCWFITPIYRTIEYYIELYRYIYHRA